MSWVLTLFAVAALLFLPLSFSSFANKWNGTQRAPLPPGPTKLPIVENLFDMPQKFIWIEYMKMCRKYNSDIIHLSALGTSIIILGSVRLVDDLFEKRSRIYSSRPHSVMLHELMGWKMFGFAPYGEEWRAQRKIVNQALPPGDIGRFHPKLLEATHDLLQIIGQSDDPLRYLPMWAAAFTMDITYGIQKEEIKLYLPTAMEVLNSLLIAGSPGAFYVDQIPLLKYIPEWFPGTGFKIKAREWGKMRIKMTEDSFNATKEQIKFGAATPSAVSFAMQHINPAQDEGQQEELIKEAFMGMYTASGGIETAVSALESGILALLMNPDVQANAHRELDMVLGPGASPSFGDEPLMPYITAIVREIHRFQPVAPLGVPHVVTQDDTYEDYFIPKGSILMPNIWSILHNEEDYPNPNQFNPSRFLDTDGRIDPNVRDPTDFTFGFGRRICPGRHIASASLWITIASILACYTIEPPLDEQGKPIKPTGQWSPAQSLVNHPLPFKCRFVPRFKNVEMNLGVKLNESEA